MLSRRILLIGASSGIGLELARRLAADGHCLALSARRGGLVRELAASLPPLARPAVMGGAQGGPGVVQGASEAEPGALRETPIATLAHAAFEADVNDPMAIGELVDRAEAAIGPLDTLIYSAGGARFFPVEETSDEVWAEMLGGNLTGLFHVVRAIVPLFRARRRGHILAMLSIASRTAFAGSTAYTAAKFGALGFIESLRAELRDSDIHVTGILPGATATPLWDALGPGWDRSRMMQPEQVARLIAAVLRETSTGTVEEIRVGPLGGPL